MANWKTEELSDTFMVSGVIYEDETSPTRGAIMLTLQKSNEEGLVDDLAAAVLDAGDVRRLIKALRKELVLSILDVR